MPEALAKGSLTGRTILVVEDDPDGGELIKLSLERQGASVVLAATAGSALDAMSQGRFDAVVSDLGLPDLDGCALMQEVRRRDPDVFAVALTGFSSTDDIERTKEAGFSAHLVKPVNPRDLIRVLLERSAPH
jgi:CheY-like chemotaxis protein